MYRFKPRLLTFSMLLSSSLVMALATVPVVEAASDKKMQLIEKQGAKAKTKSEKKLALFLLKGEKAANAKYPKKAKKPKVSLGENAFGKADNEKLKKLRGPNNERKMTQLAKKLGKKNEKKLKDMKAKKGKKQ